MLIEDNTSEIIEIDTLVNLIKMAYAFENWEKVISLSASLLESANEMNNIMLNKTTKIKRTKRHISYYFGYSSLMKGLALQKLKEYSKSIKCISLYSDLSWLDDNTEEAAIIISDFKLFAKANSLTIEILMGNRERTLEYVEFLEKNPEQVLSGLITLLESAIVHTYNIDKEISLLIRYIHESSAYIEQVVASKYLSFRFMLALYYYLNKSYLEAVDNALQILEVSDMIKNDKYFKKSVTLFEILKVNALGSQLEEYSIILKRILKGEIANEEGIDISSRFNNYHFQ